MDKYRKWSGELGCNKITNLTGSKIFWVMKIRIVCDMFECV